MEAEWEDPDSLVASEAVVSTLDRYADLQVASDAVRLRYQEQIDKLLAPILSELRELELRRDTEIQAIETELAVLKEAIRLEVLSARKTIKGERIMAIYNKPRITWDNKGLEGFSVAHPEINAFRREGEPSVSIRLR